MNKLRKKIFTLVVIAQFFVLTILAGCTQSLPATICHATGDPANPYEVVTISNSADLKEHLGHPNDIIASPEGGCPTGPVVVTDGKITICHATGSETNPYNEITVSVNGLDGHDTHEGDIIPAPEGGCPTSLLDIVDDKISICHATGDENNPYEEVLVRVNGLDGHVSHTEDIIPAPVSGCPTTLLVIVDGKVSICHSTGSKTNPYEEITVSVNGLNGHDKHEDDIIPAPVAGCPKSPVVVDNDGKITICHATGSDKNPYTAITVSVNGLNGHDKHENDIIPAPEGGCPTTKQ